MSFGRLSFYSRSHLHTLMKGNTQQFSYQIVNLTWPSGVELGSLEFSLGLHPEVTGREGSTRLHFKYCQAKTLSALIATQAQVDIHVSDGYGG